MEMAFRGLSRIRSEVLAAGAPPTPGKAGAGTADRQDHKHVLINFIKLHQLLLKACLTNLTASTSPCAVPTRSLNA